MRTLKTSEAAALLDVGPNTLRAWERRFGYPKPQRGRRLYTHGKVAALRDALQQGLSRLASPPVRPLAILVGDATRNELFRRVHRGGRVRTTGTRTLPQTPFGAHRQLLAFVDDRGDRGKPAPTVELIDDREVREAQA